MDTGIRQHDVIHDFLISVFFRVFRGKKSLLSLPFIFTFYVGTP